MESLEVRPDGGPPVRHLLLDADGVLQRHPLGFPAATAGFVDDPQAFFDEVSRREVAFLRGGDGFLDVLTEALEARGATATAAQVHEAVWQQFRTDPEMTALVAGVRRRGVGVHLATNQEPARAAVMKASAHLRGLDRSYYSCDLGAAKPDVAYFEAILDDLDADAAEVLFVDDKAENVEGARAAGLRAERWVNTQDVTVLRDLLTRHGL